MPSKNDVPYDFGDRVIIDKDESIVGVVIAISTREVQLQWLHGGDVKSTWIDQWRLSPAPEAGQFIPMRAK